MENLAVPKGKVLSDGVVVKTDDAMSKTKAGIIIPGAAKEKPKQGTVVKVGPGFKDIPMELEEGDKVLYGAYTGTEISVEDTDYLLMRQSDILYILPKEEE